MRLLGISAFYHDSAALIEDGRIMAAAQEERLRCLMRPLIQVW
jgi:carbamoyltransferase